MDNQDKLKEIAHIRTLLAGDGNDDDDINARVWCLVNPKWESFPCVNNWLRLWQSRGHCVARSDFPFSFKDHSIVPKYTTDRNALRDIEDEGWEIYTLRKYTNGYVIVMQNGHEDEIGHDKYQLFGSECLPTFERAHLDAILQTKMWELEQD